MSNLLVAGNNNRIGIKLTRAVRIEEDDFQITLALTSAAVSEVACGARFAIAGEMGYLTSENGFQFDEENARCNLGIVSFPVEELEQGGIMVHGTSENLYYFINGFLCANSIRLI